MMLSGCVGHGRPPLGPAPNLWDAPVALQPPPAAPCGPVAPPEPDPAALAIVAWSQRDQRAELDGAIGNWQRARQMQPHNVAVLLHLAEAQAFLGDVQAAEGTPAVAAWQAGADAAQAALQATGAASDAAAALFWFGVNTYKVAWTSGLASALRHSEAITQALRQSVAQDPNYYHGAAQSFLASHLCRLPPGLGGDLAQAEQLFADAQSRAPQFFPTRVMMAYDWALRAQRADTFQTALRAVVHGPSDALPERQAEQRLAQRQAAALLQAHPLWAQPAAAHDAHE